MFEGYTMQRHNVRAVLGLAGCIALLSGASCGGKGYLTEPQIPGVGQEVSLVQVDGVPVPTVIASSAVDQTTVVSGKATLGEAIASGTYLISLRRATGMTGITSTVSGTVVFVWTEKTVAATIDLGAGLRAHTFTFSRN